MALLVEVKQGQQLHCTNAKTQRRAQEKKNMQKEREKKREENESVLNEIDRKRQHVQQVIFESLA